MILYLLCYKQTIKLLPFVAEAAEKFLNQVDMAHNTSSWSHGILIFSCLLFVLVEKIYNHGILIIKTKPDGFQISYKQNVLRGHP